MNFIQNAVVGNGYTKIAVVVQIADMPQLSYGVRLPLMQFVSLSLAFASFASQCLVLISYTIEMLHT